MESRSVEPARGPLAAEFRAVPSKSATHRLLVLGAMSEGRTVLEDPLDADDTRRTLEGLAALGFRVDEAGNAWTVEGLGGRVPGGASVDAGESGTTARFLAAGAALGERPSRLDGGPRMRERPMADLASALAALGARVETAPSGALPWTAGGVRPRGGAAAVRSDRSSQFASALLLVGPALAEGLDLELGGGAVSLPYVRLSLDAMRTFGIRVAETGERRFRVEPGRYPGRRARVEGDHSSASYFLAAAAVAGGRVRVTGLDPGSAQPDARLGALLRTLGVVVRSGQDWVEAEAGAPLPGFEADLADAPDLLPTVGVLALFARGPCRLTGLGHARLKESDRLEAVAENLRGMGREARAAGGCLEVRPPEGPPRGATIRTRGDHRLAMAFAVAGLATRGVVVDDAGCVSKSNPGFWDQFRGLEG